MGHNHSYGVLIDAGYLKKALGTREKPATIDDIDAFLTELAQSTALRDLTLHRIYFYDAKPSAERKHMPLNGGEVDFAKSDVAARNNALHAQLCRRPYVALRLGELVFRGWRLKKHALPGKKPEVRIVAGDLQPNLTQKGVDMRIGLDIAALALKRIVQVVVLVTSDTDFIPAMKFARREGLQLFLVAFGNQIHDGLHEHSDLVIDLPRPHRAAAEPAVAEAPAS